MTVELEHRESVLARPGWMVTTAEQIEDTGEHPVASERPTKGRHAAPWTVEQVRRDAIDGMHNRGALTPKHRDRSFLAGALLLTRDQAALAQWTIAELKR